MDKIDIKIKQLMSEGQNLIEERTNLENQFNQINRRLIEIEGAIRVLREINSQNDVQ